MKTTMLAAGAVALAAAGCAPKAPTLPDEPVERAAACGVIAAASERAAAGAKGDLPAAGQERIFHYSLLAGARGAGFDDKTAQTVNQRMPELFEQLTKGDWQSLKPACAKSFPATQVAQPTLPAKALDSMLQCYVLTEFMRRSLASASSSYGDVTTRYGVFTAALDTRVSAALAKAGIDGGAALQAKRAEALSAAAKLGQPPAVIAACTKKYG